MTLGPGRSIQGRRSDALYRVVWAYMARMVLNEQNRTDVREA